jgi:hypothetical protein
MSEQKEEKRRQQPEAPRLEDLQRTEAHELNEKDAENVRGGLVSGNLTSDDKW